MDAEFRSWTQKQDGAQAEQTAEIRRLADQVTLLAHELASIAMLLAPKVDDGPSPLEALLAQLVAQNQEIVGHLRSLVRQGDRIESKLAGHDAGPSLPPNGNGRATRP